MLLVFCCCCVAGGKREREGTDGRRDRVKWCKKAHRAAAARAASQLTLMGDVWPLCMHGESERGGTCPPSLWAGCNQVKNIIAQEREGGVLVLHHDIHDDEEISRANRYFSFPFCLPPNMARLADLVESI